MQFADVVIRTLAGTSDVLCWALLRKIPGKSPINLQSSSSLAGGGRSYESVRSSRGRPDLLET